MDIAAKPPRKSTSCLKKAAAVVALGVSAVGGFSAPQPNILKSTAAVSPMKSKLPNGVTVYGDQQARDRLTGLVNEFPTIWQDAGSVNLPKE